MKITDSELEKREREREREREQENFQRIGKTRSIGALRLLFFFFLKKLC